MDGILKFQHMDAHSPKLGGHEFDLLAKCHEMWTMQ